MPAETSWRGDDERFVCHVPDGFHCVFSLERQPCGLCRHLSISINKPRMLPHPAAVSELMTAFGFKKPIMELHGLERAGGPD